MEILIISMVYNYVKYNDYMYHYELTISHHCLYNSDGVLFLLMWILLLLNSKLLHPFRDDFYHETNRLSD